MLVIALTGQNPGKIAKPEISIKVESLLDSAEFYTHKCLDTAVDFALSAREIASKHNYTEGEVKGLAKAAFILTFKGEPVKMQEIYNQAIYIGQNLTDKSALIDAYFKMGVSYRSLHQFDKSYYYYQQGMDLIFADLDNQTDETMASMYEQLGYLLFRELNDSTVSINFMHKSKDLFLKIGDTTNYLDCYNKIGDIYRYNRNNPLTRHYFDSTKFLLNKHYVKSVDATYNKLMAAWLFDSKNLAQGLEYLKKAEELFFEIRDLKELADVYTMFAFVASNMNEIDKCLDYNYKALELREHIGHSFLISSSLFNLANNYYKLNLYPKAFDFAERALKLALNAGHNFYSHKYAHSLYRMHKGNQDFNTSLIYLELADSLSSLLPRTDNIGSSKLIENKIRLQNRELLESSKAEISHTKTQLEYSIYISLLLLFVIVIFIFWIFKLKMSYSEIK